MNNNPNPFVGTYTYRSLTNDPKIETEFNNLELTRATLEITAPSFEQIGGTLGIKEYWLLNIRGSISYGSPAQIRFQAKGIVNNEEWVYDYIGWLVPIWPNSTDTHQRKAIVGSVVRSLTHTAPNGSTRPAGAVVSFYAVAV